MNSGGGITLCNLFRGWSPENLAVATSPKSILKSDFNFCSNYYRLGADEDNSCILFKFIEKASSGVVSSLNLDRIKNSTSKSYIRINFKAFLVSTFIFLSEKLGLNFWCDRYKLSNKFISWVNDFNPDYIYTQLSTYQLILLSKELININKCKLVIHIMDDWPRNITSNCWLGKNYWDKVIDRSFRDLVECSYKFLTISHGMKVEYLERYGKTSDVFHNPVDTNLWQELSHTASMLEPKTKSFKILYSGRIGKANKNCIFLMIQAIDFIRNKLERDIELYVYSLDHDLLSLKGRNYLHLNKPIDHLAIPGLLRSVDLLYLPLDFDQNSIQFAKFSMPTKASEYMISGTPILLFAPSETYLYQHALINNWAKIVGDYSLEKLIEAIVEIQDNLEIRNNIVIHAKDFALKNFDAIIIREEFKKIFD